MLATFHYPGFLASYENRGCNPMPLLGRGIGAGSAIHGTEASLVVNRSGCWLIPNPKSEVAEATWVKDSSMSQMNTPHWQNFLACMKSREKPISDIETCVRSSTTCILANLAMRFKTRLDWDEQNWTVQQQHMRRYLTPHYRRPWKLEV